MTLRRLTPASLVFAKGFRVARGHAAIGRAMSLTAAAVALVVVLPVMAVIALAVKLDSRGPVFFRQERIGRHGERFSLLKFRTMRFGAHEERSSVEHLNASGDGRPFTIPHDPRVSRVGSFLRRWSLDALPQFLNVIAGHMSLVGPRPFFERDFGRWCVSPRPDS